MGERFVASVCWSRGLFSVTGNGSIGFDFTGHESRESNKPKEQKMKPSCNWEQWDRGPLFSFVNFVKLFMRLHLWALYFFVNLTVLSLICRVIKEKQEQLEEMSVQLNLLYITTAYSFVLCLFPHRILYDSAFPVSLLPSCIDLPSLTSLYHTSTFLISLLLISLPLQCVLIHGGLLWRWRCCLTHCWINRLLRSSYIHSLDCTDQA